MNKESFNNLSILDQVNFINNELKEKTLRKACDDISIIRSTMRERFKKVGYYYNNEISEYVFDNTKVIQPYRSNTKELPTTYNVGIIPSEVAITKEIQKEYKNVVKVVPKEHKDITTKIQTYENELLELIYNKDDILVMLKEYKGTTKTTENPVLDLNELPKSMKGDIVNKSIKVYEPIYKKFLEVCSEYSSYKKQDLISLALYEFITRYKK